MQIRGPLKRWAMSPWADEPAHRIPPIRWANDEPRSVSQWEKHLFHEPAGTQPAVTWSLAPWLIAAIWYNYYWYVRGLNIRYEIIITHSLFHSRLKTFFFCKSFPLQPFFFFFRTYYMIPHTFTVTSNISAFTFYFFCFTIFSCRFRAVDLSRLMSAFERTLKSIGPRPMSINVMMILGSWNNEWISLFTTKVDETIACRSKRKKEKKRKKHYTVLSITI